MAGLWSLPLQEEEAINSPPPAATATWRFLILPRDNNNDCGWRRSEREGLGKGDFRSYDEYVALEQFVCASTTGCLAKHHISQPEDTRRERQSH